MIDFSLHPRIRQNPLILPGWQLCQTMGGAFQGVLNEIMNSLPQEAVSKAYTNPRGKQRGSRALICGCFRRQPFGNLWHRKSLCHCNLEAGRLTHAAVTCHLLVPVPKTQSHGAVTGAFSFFAIPSRQFSSESL